MQVHSGQFLHEHFKGGLAVEDVPGVVVQPVLNMCSPFLGDILHALPFRQFAANQYICVIAANMWGKVKTVLQMLTVLFYYFAAALAGPADVMAVGLITQILCWLCGAATVLSGGIYLWQNRSLFMQAK